MGEVVASEAKVRENRVVRSGQKSSYNISLKSMNNNSINWILNGKWNFPSTWKGTRFEFKITTR